MYTTVSYRISPALPLNVHKCTPVYEHVYNNVYTVHVHVHVFHCATCFIFPKTRMLRISNMLIASSVTASACSVDGTVEPTPR